MLSIVSRFRKRATTREVLEGIDEDTKRLESSRDRNQKLQKKIVLSLLTFSILIYCVAVAVFYFLLLPDSWSDRAIWIILFASFPILVYFLKRFFHLFFVTRIKWIGQEIAKLNELKRDILDDVTENETYKVATELLERFDPHGQIIKRDFAVKQSPEVQRVAPQVGQQGELRYRANAATPNVGRPMTPNSLPSSPIHGNAQQNARFMSPNFNPRAVGMVATSTPGASSSNGVSRAGMVSPGPIQRKYPVLPLEKSVFDKIAEYFVGDGPSYRFALICKACHGHNGMALKDEFEYIAFRCCYCGAANPSRRARPNAPPLDDTKLSDQEYDKEKSKEDDQKDVESETENPKEKLKDKTYEEGSDKSEHSANNRQETTTRENEEDTSK